MILREDTLGLIERLAQKAKLNRSRFIDRAVWHYAKSVGTRELRRRLREGYERSAEPDRRLVEEWLGVAEETWPDNRGRPR